MKKQFIALALVLALLFSALPGPLATAAASLDCDFDRDGEMYSFFAKDATGNTVFSVDLEPTQVGDELFYMFNPMAFGLKLEASIEYGLEELGFGKCPIIRFSVPLPGCCGISGYALLSEGTQSSYSTLLLCDTEKGQPAVSYANGTSRVERDSLLRVSAVYRELYQDSSAGVTQLTGFAIAPYNKDAGAVDCKIEEVRLDTLTLFFSSGEEACDCLAALLEKLGVPGAVEEDYYYTENGTDFWYIPLGKDRGDAICVSNQETGYYVVSTTMFDTAFLQGAYTTELVDGDSSVFYMSFAEPVVDCVGVISDVQMTMIGLEDMSKYMWGIGVKEAPTEKWFFMDYFDYKSAASSGEMTRAGVIFPKPMTVDGFIVSPMEYFSERYVMNYSGAGIFLFANGKAAMRFMRQLENYPREQREQQEQASAAPTAFTQADLLNLEALRYTYNQVMPEVIQAMVPEADRSDATRYMSLGSATEQNQDSPAIFYTNAAGDVGLFARYAAGTQPQASTPAQMTAIFAHEDFFPMISSVMCSFIPACDSTVDVEKLSSWMNGLYDTESSFKIGSYTLKYTCNTQLKVFTYALAKAEAQTQTAAPAAAAKEIDWERLSAVPELSSALCGYLGVKKGAALSAEQLASVSRLVILENGYSFENADTAYQAESPKEPKKKLDKQRLNNIVDAVTGAGLPIRSVIISGMELESPEPLKKLAGLEELFLERTKLTDLSFLQNMTSLRRLSLKWNKLTTISALAHLTDLEWLNLSLNDIVDISLLSKLTGLRELIISSNDIVDLFPLSGLENLQKLKLSYNKITDVSALGGLVELTELDLSGNDIVDVSALRHLVKLEKLFLGSNEIKDISALSELRQLQTLSAYANKIGSLSCVAGMTELTELSVGNNSITDIAPLKGLRKLIDLSLYENEIEDLSPLAELTRLTSLRVSDNKVRDIGPLAGLTEINDLSLSNNRISDFSALSGMTRLEKLYINGNGISDLTRLVSVLEKLPGLKTLYLDDNNISNAGPLSSLVRLEDLSLDGNKVTGVPALKGLKSLSLDENGISDLSWLTGFDALEYLSLEENKISGIALLAKLKRLETLYLDKNEITDVSGLKGMSSLKTLSLGGNHIFDFSPIAKSGLTILGQYSQTYIELSSGKTGDMVRKLQERLIELKYLIGSADGVYGTKTAQAVKEFCEGNGLTATETATEEVQKKIFSSSAVPFTDPYMPLVILNGSYGKWYFYDCDKMSMRVEVTNISKRTTVKSFEVYMYAVDVWGNEIYGNSVYYDTTYTTVNPGATVYCSDIYLPQRSRIDKVYVGIHKVTLSDGTVRENYPVDYSYWVIQ